MAGAHSEISHWRRYDYVIVNTELEAAYAQLEALLKAERLKRQRQTGLDRLVRDLLGET